MGYANGGGWPGNGGGMGYANGGGWPGNGGGMGYANGGGYPGNGGGMGYANGGGWPGNGGNGGYANAGSYRRGGYDRSGGRRPSPFAGQANPFEGASEANIMDLTESLLKDSNDVAYVTQEGKVVHRNVAFRMGEKNALELAKERPWGGEEEDAAYIAQEGKVVRRDEASRMGEEDALVKEPFWGGGRASEVEGAPQPVEVLFSQEACQAIAREALSSDGLETGGALIGAWERGLDGRISVRVERATGPGPEAKRQAALFSPDLDYYRYRVGYYRQWGWDYLGEWHKHPDGLDGLSSLDMGTAQELMRDEGWPMLLLPVVNVADGEVRMESNVFLSKQLGGGLIPHASSLLLSPGPEPEPVTVYMDARALEEFRAGSEDVRALTGVCNPGESYVFLPIPGLKDAVLKLVRDGGGDAPISGMRNAVTAIVGPDDVRCYHVREGEVLPLEPVVIDPAHSIYERNAGLTETAALKDKAVTIVGCGSLGSTLAMSLARAGVGTFYLFDMDRLSPVNIARHQAGLKDLGRAKAAVVRDLIHGTDPTIDVEACALDVVDTAEGFEAFCAAAAHSDLLICTTDTDSSRLLVERAAVERGILSLQAGLTERAAQGVIHLYDPASPGACWACHRELATVESGKRAEGVAYSEAESIRDLTIQPGLAAQIDAVAEVAALRAIDALMGRRSLPSATFVYIDEAEGDADEGRRLHLTMRHADLEAVPTCPLCGEEAGLPLPPAEGERAS